MNVLWASRGECGSEVCALPSTDTGVSRAEEYGDAASTELGKLVADTLGIALWDRHFVVAVRSADNVGQSFLGEDEVQPLPTVSGEDQRGRKRRSHTSWYGSFELSESPGSGVKGGSPPVE